MALNFREMPTGGKRKKGDRVMRKTLPMNLQLFAEGGDGNGGQNAGGDSGQAGQQGNQNNQQAAGVDYDKIQAMLDNATAKKENAVLKSYFQQQGLSEDEIRLLQHLSRISSSRHNSSRTLMLIFRMKWQQHRRLLNRLRLSLLLQR